MAHKLIGGWAPCTGGTVCLGHGFFLVFLNVLCMLCNGVTFVVIEYIFGCTLPCKCGLFLLYFLLRVFVHTVALLFFYYLAVPVVSDHCLTLSDLSPWL